MINQVISRQRTHENITVDDAASEDASDDELSDDDADSYTAVKPTVNDDGSDDEYDGEITVGTFDGTGSWDSFWWHFCNAAEYHSWSQIDKCARLVAALEGDAALALKVCGKNATFAELSDYLVRTYDGEVQRQQACDELRCYRQRPDESLTGLAIGIRSRAQKGYPQLTEAERDTALGLPTFIHSINNRDLRFYLQLQKPSTLDEALAKARWIEWVLESNGPTSPIRHIRVLC